MSAAQIATPHIVFDEQGIPWLDDTNVKVIEVVLDALADGLSPREIHLEHQNTLSLAQIHAALGYYYDHQAEMDAEIKRYEDVVDSLRAQSSEPQFVERLRTSGRLP